MKKFFILAVTAVMFMFASCTSCSKSTPNDSDSVEVAVDTMFNVERAIAMDKQFMYDNYGGDYKWYECCILMENYMDEDTNGEVAGVSNVFQVQEEHGKSTDVYVVLTAHTPDTATYEVKQGFWVEDYSMNAEEINVTFAEAFAKVMTVNCPKPHSRQCVLRKEVGPKAANAQYIFGNMQAQIYVDAVTGDVSETNPVFPEE